MPPTVSVVIPAYNRQAYLPECLDSVLAQDFPDAEIIVVDDGSTDGTQDVLGRYGGRVASIRQANAGVSAARTAGIRAARSNLIAFVDSDDKMLPGRLQRQYAFMQEHPDVAAVSGNIVIQGMEDSDFLAGAGVTFSGRDYVIYDHAFPMLLKRNFMANPGAMFRRDRFFEIGGFDIPLLRSNSEDWDLWLRLSRRWGLACLNWPCTWVRRHAGNISSTTAEVESKLAVVEKALRCGETIDADVLAAVKRRRYGLLKEYIVRSLHGGATSDWVGKVALYSRLLPWRQRLFLRSAVALAPLTRLLTGRNG